MTKCSFLTTFPRGQGISIRSYVVGLVYDSVYLPDSLVKDYSLLCVFLPFPIISPSCFLNILFIYFQRRGKGGRKRGRETSTCERYINQSTGHPQPGTWPTTQACALTGNQTSNPLICRPALSPLSHTLARALFLPLYFVIFGL